MRKIVAALFVALGFAIAAGCGGHEQVCTCTCTCDDGTQPPITTATDGAECKSMCDVACDPQGFVNLWECSSMTE